MVLAVLAERCLAVQIYRQWILWFFLASIVILTTLSWFFKRPSTIQLALLIDQRLSLHERFSTALTVADRDDPFAHAAITDAHQAARNLKIEGRFPVRLSRRWLLSAGIWGLAGILVLFMPQMDLWGRLKEKQQEQEKVEQLEQAKTEVRSAIKAVSSAVKQLAEPELAEELGKFESALAEELKPDEVRRQAIRRLGDLSDKIRQSQEDQMDMARMTRQMLRRLRGSAGELTRELNQALAQSNFGRADQIMEEFQRQIAQSELSEEQRRALAQQLEKLAQQLKDLAQQDQRLEKELEKMDLDKKLAQMNPEELRKVLEKMGLDEEAIKQMLRMAGSSRLACSQISRLGEALAGVAGGGPGGLSGDEMAELAEQLGEMEALQEEFYLTQATLDEIARSIAALGEGECGYGGYGEYMEGLDFEFGPGTGGPGRGWGPRRSEESGATATQKTRTKTQTGAGPMIASWMFEGPQVKGESRRQLEELADQAQSSVAEAISEDEIPRKYETTIKKYFGALKQTDKK